MIASGRQTCCPIRSVPSSLCGPSLDNPRARAAAGFNSHLVKPVDLDLLTKLLASLGTN